MTTNNVFVVSEKMIIADWELFSVENEENDTPMVRFRHFGDDVTVPVSQGVVDMLSAAFCKKDSEGNLVTNDRAFRKNVLSTRNDDDGVLEIVRIDVVVGYFNARLLYNIKADKVLFLYGHGDERKVAFDTADKEAGDVISDKLDLLLKEAIEFEKKQIAKEKAKESA